MTYTEYRAFVTAPWTGWHDATPPRKIPALEFRFGKVLAAVPGAYCPHQVGIRYVLLHGLSEFKLFILDIVKYDDLPSPDKVNYPCFDTLPF